MSKIKSFGAIILPDEWIRDIKQTFAFYDKNEKGYLTPFEYKLAHLQLFGYSPSRIEMERLFRINSTTGEAESTVDLKKFMQMMTFKMKKMDDDYFRQIFNLFDVHGCGYISFKDFEKAFHKVSKAFPDLVIMRIFSIFDENKNGKITFNQFREMMRE